MRGRPRPRRRHASGVSRRRFSGNDLRTSAYRVAYGGARPADHANRGDVFFFWHRSHIAAPGWVDSAVASGRLQTSSIAVRTAACPPPASGLSSSGYSMRIDLHLCLHLYALIIRFRSPCAYDDILFVVRHVHPKRPRTPGELRTVPARAVIMAGNGRWAAQRHLPFEGHRAGIESCSMLRVVCALASRS